MIQFANTDTTGNIIATLTELVTVDEPIYDWVFTHVLTKDQVSFSLTEGDDLSDFPARYNWFNIDVTQFEHVGEWHYVVTEQQTGVILEKGKMIITREFNYEMYAGSTSYTAYTG
jgi:hypothetical protein